MFYREYRVPGDGTCTIIVKIDDLDKANRIKVFLDELENEMKQEEEDVQNCGEDMRGSEE